jgi:carboxyl-terminal processing protease
MKMSAKRSSSVLLLTLIGVLALGIFTGYWMPRDDDYFALRKNFQIFGALYEELVTGYVDPLNPETLMRNGIDAMLENLDPYTNFFDEADNGDIDIITRGRYGGVGLNVGLRNGEVTVVSPVEGASGYLQGVKAGDIIIRVAGQSVADLTLTDIRNILRGEPGTAVDITVTREGAPEPLEFLLTREEVQLKNVTHSGFIGGGVAAGIGYIKLERFARDAGKEVRQAIQELQQAGALNGLVLDLRDNPGGLLDAAVEITELFVPRGSVIVSTRGREPQSENTYKSNVTPLLPDVPLAILLNGISASASEIVAGAVQDLDRGIIVGSSSFGKGLVQIVKPLPYNTSLKLTTAKYFTPSGRSIQAIDYQRHDGQFSEIPDSLRRSFQTAAGRIVKDGRGIEPDLDASDGAQSELEQALIRRAAFFFFANHFASEYDQIPVDFVVTDDVFRGFREWLNEENFTYRTTAEQSAEELAERLAAIGYDETNDELTALRAALKAEKEKDFDRYKDLLKEQLRAQILARYHGDSAQVEASLSHDTQYAAALDILQDREKYLQLLR